VKIAVANCDATVVVNHRRHFAASNSILLVMKKFLLLAVILGSLSLPLARAQSPEVTPKTVIHVVTVSWKATATPEQIQAAMDGVKALPGNFKGIVRVWTKPIKVQGERTFAFVMEFADQAALAAYTDSPAQKKWYEVYLPIREESTTFDITN
jgi:hypothetical protein